MTNNNKLKCYKDFRGLDLASDQSLSSSVRSPFMVNMYKDYASSLGKAIETIVGFRKRVAFDENIAGDLHDFYFFTKNTQSGSECYPILHKGSSLYLWNNFPNDKNLKVDLECDVVSGEISLGFTVSSVTKVEIDGESVIFSISQDKSKVFVDQTINLKKAKVSLIKSAFSNAELLYSGVAQKKLNYFTYGDRLYILDGSKYLTYDGVTVSQVTPYIPTTRTGITSSGMGVELDFRNMLSDYFYNEISANESDVTYYLSENNLDEITSVTVYGEQVSNYTANLTEGSVTFSSAPQAPIEKGYDDGYCGIKVLCKKSLTGEKGKVLKMTISDLFDGRVFLSGNGEYSSAIVYSALDDMSYFPIVNYIFIESRAIESLLAISNDLFAIAKEGEKSGIYQLTAYDTGISLNPTAYAVKALSTSVGCVNNAINFLDCPTFLSKSGLRAVASPNLKSERNIEKRSSLIAPALIDLENKDPILFSFDGYIAIYFDGKMFLGDSRQNYRNEQGEYEFEWYEINEIGSYKNQYHRYVFADTVPSYLSIELLAEKEMIGNTANSPKDDGNSEREILHKGITVDGEIKKYDTVVYSYLVPTDIVDGEINYQTIEKEYLVEEKEDFIGGVFEKANFITSFSGNIYFCNSEGLFSFNFDKKKEGYQKENYSFNNRIIFSGISTIMDNVGYPDLRKSTLPKSLVVKCKTMENSGAKIKVRTDKRSFKQYGIINSGYFNFDKVDFDNTSFNTSDQQVYLFNEKEKGWLEKQICIYSDKYQTPFSVYYITYRFMVKGKVK